MNEPTMKEIAEALNKAANLFRAFAFTNINKQQKNLLLDDLRNFIVLAAQVEAMGETNAQWRAELDKVMPPDFKDWWQNSPKELPLVAALVIKNLREQLDAAEAQVEAMGERRCLNCEEWLGGIHPVFGCSYDGLIHCKKLNIPGQGPNFGCVHWKRKEG